MYNRLFSNDSLHNSVLSVLCGAIILFGNVSYGWNSVLISGLGGSLLSLVLYSIGFICYTLSALETYHALPFADGSYSVVRNVVNYYSGFIVGCCIVFQHILYASIIAWHISNLLIQAVKATNNIAPLLFFTTHALCLAAILFQKHGLTSWILLILAYAIILYAIYIFGSDATSDVPKYSQSGEHRYISNNSNNFLQGFASIGYIFFGLDGFLIRNTLQSSTDKTPPVLPSMKNVSAKLSITFIAIMLIYFACITNKPGIASLSKVDYPLSEGFASILQIATTSSYILFIPILCIALVLFHMESTRILHSMSHAKLLPLLLNCSYNDVPYVYLGVSICLSFSFSMIIFGHPALLTNIYHIGLLLGCVGIILHCCAHIRIRLTYSQLIYQVYSPVGIVGDVLAIATTLLTIISIIGFQSDSGIHIVTMIIFVGIISLYYTLIVQKQQIFSEEEVKLNFTAMIVKHNHRIQERMKHGSSHNSSRTRSRKSSNYHASSTKNRSIHSLYSKKSPAASYRFTSSRISTIDENGGLSSKKIEQSNMLSVIMERVLRVPGQLSAKISSRKRSFQVLPEPGSKSVSIKVNESTEVSQREIANKIALQMKANKVLGCREDDIDYQWYLNQLNQGAENIDFQDVMRKLSSLERGTPLPKDCRERLTRDDDDHMV
jgi:hypothetical protein